MSDTDILTIPLRGLETPFEPEVVPFVPRVVPPTPDDIWPPLPSLQDTGVQVMVPGAFDDEFVNDGNYNHLVAGDAVAPEDVAFADEMAAAVNAAYPGEDATHTSDDNASPNGEGNIPVESAVPQEGGAVPQEGDVSVNIPSLEGLSLHVAPNEAVGENNPVCLPFP